MANQDKEPAIVLPTKMSNMNQQPSANHKKYLAQQQDLQLIVHESPVHYIRWRVNQFRQTIHTSVQGQKAHLVIARLC